MDSIINDHNPPIVPVDPEGPTPSRSGPWLAVFLVSAALSIPWVYCLLEPMPPCQGTSDTVLPLGRGAGIALGLLLLSGVSGTMVLLLAMLASPETRNRLSPLRVVDRPIPAVGLADLLFGFLMTRILVQIAAMALMAGMGQKPPLERMILLSLGLQLPFYAVTILIIVRMAQMRGGPFGAAGIWPFWKTPGVTPTRCIGRDVVSGVLVFVLCFWILVGLRFLNKAYLDHLHLPPDVNPIVTSLFKEPAGSHGAWVYAGVILAVVVVAPIAEEVLFRGLLYNVLCRYLDRWTATCAGALFFSFFHGVIADQWALFALGLVLTLVYERTGRLLPAVVLHAANNAVAVGFMLSTQVQ